MEIIRLQSFCGERNKSLVSTLKSDFLSMIITAINEQVDYDGVSWGLCLWKKWFEENHN